MGDYDDGNNDYDDYSSNASAYMSWSLVWPLFWFVGGIIGFFTALKNLVQKILDL